MEVSNMSNESIINNRFDPRKTKTVIIHDGRFHADDVMFAAMAIIVAEKHRNKIQVIRTSQLPDKYSPDIIVGDVGMGVYDHHVGIDGTVAVGAQNNTEDYLSAACGLLYRDIKDILFPGDSETKNVFAAFIDVIEHCDNTPDNNTFSDSINFFAPINDNQTDSAAINAINYCKAVISGFVEAHEKEKGGKRWAIPRVCSGIVPGIAEKRESRYWKASNQIKNRYKYVSFNNKTDMKLRAIDTYSLACGVLNQRRRQYWREEIEQNDALQVAEMERRDREVWPQALASMQSRTIFLDQYVPYGQYVKDIPALFVITPSQRGGYNVNILKTNTGKYRFEPDLLTKFNGCSFVANDKRFVFFDTKEQALKAAHTAGDTVGRYFDKYGFNAYRNIYGGLKDGYIGDFYQDLISEDIALNMYVREKVKNPDSMSVAEYRRLQLAVMGNPYLTHAFCVRFDGSGEEMRWTFDVSVADIPGLNQNNLWTKSRNGSSWDIGLQSYVNTPTGIELFKQVHPDAQQTSGNAIERRN
jgi:uncharacterized UPF0160 family protein